jgi:hypothetical protein
MAGMFLNLPTTFTDTSSPIYLDDPMESAGTLMLLDPQHALTSWAAGVPANNAILPNVFRTKAAALMGVTAAEADPVYLHDGYLSGSLGKVERTTKGGLHVIQSTTATAQNKGVLIRFPKAVMDYMKANKTHSYYISNWANDTKAPTGGVVMPTAIHSAANPHALQVAGVQGPGASPANDPTARVLGNYGSSSTGAGAPTGPLFRNGAVSNVTGWADQYTVWGTTVQNNSALFVHGTYGANGYGASLGAEGSRVLYRAYLEDLTVSGRTYAQAHAIDIAAYTNEVLTAGGRYYSDTIPTSPATIP